MIIYLYIYSFFPNLVQHWLSGVQPCSTLTASTPLADPDSWLPLKMRILTLLVGDVNNNEDDHYFISCADMLVQKGIRPKDALLVAIRQIFCLPIGKINFNFWPKCKRYLYSSSICLGQKTFNFREEYVDGAEYLLKHEEDTHIEGQVCKQHLTDTSLYKDTHDKCADNTLWIHLYVCRYF